MTTRYRRLVIYLAIGAVVVDVFQTSLLAQTSTFTYQGHLSSGGSPANGTFDFQFTLWDALTGGTQQPVDPVTISRLGVTVTNGMFSVELDFGGELAFPGADRYLAIQVRPVGQPVYTTLSPRQQITTNPYALRSVTATNAAQLGGIAADQYVLTTDSRLNGTPGPPGPDGPPGEAGPPGPAGADGLGVNVGSCGVGQVLKGIDAAGALICRNAGVTQVAAGIADTSTVSFDLDTGAYTCGSCGADIRFVNQGATPQGFLMFGGAAASIFGTSEPSLTDCLTSPATFTGGVFAGPPVGSYMCVNTSASNVSRVKVLAYPPASGGIYSIEFTTWSVEGAIGPPGPVGPPGPAGPAGPTGPAGVTAAVCASGKYMTGINVSGNIVCATPGTVTLIASGTANSSTVSFDLDTGTYTCGSCGADIRFVNQGATPQGFLMFGGATAGTFGASAPTPTQCLQAAQPFLGGVYAGPPVGSYMCVHTSGGNVASVRITAYPPASGGIYAIDYITWHID